MRPCSISRSDLRPSRRHAALRLAGLLTAAGSFAGCEGESKLGVYREPPVVTITAPPTGTEVYTGQPVNFEAQVQVFDNTKPTDISHRWVGGDETMCEGDDYTFAADGFGSCTWDFSEPGAVTVQVTATDPNGDRAMYSIDIVVLANSPPSIEMVGPDDNSNWSSEDLIVFDAVVADAEEDPANLIVSAHSNIDGAISFASAPTSTGEWAGGTELTAGSHLLTFTVEDSYGQSDQDTLQINAFDNGPPSIDSASIDPIPAYTEDDLTAVPDGWYDLTGSSERYRYVWYIDDGSTGTFVEDPAVSTSVYPAGKTKKHDLLYVEVTPYNEFGDGATESTPVVEIENSPPEQPSIALDPSAPEPDDNVQAVILVGSYDADGDAVTYSYAWFVNGLDAGYTTNVLPQEAFENGDTIEVIVTPNDGEEDGPSISASSVATDVTPPDDPVINTPEAYRNEDEWTLTGTCEPGSTVDFSCSDSITSWTFSLTCEADGSFEYNDTGLTRGETASCSAIATDSAGNVSGASNTVSTEVCDPEDTYEDDFGTGDAGVDAIDRWTALADDGRTTISIEGNILGASDSVDWYVISSSDDLASDRLAGIDYYNFEVTMVDGTSDYYFYVYEGTPDAADQECSTTTGYTEYSDFVEDVGEGFHAIPTETRACNQGGHVDYNDCEDRSTDYYIEVRRSTSSTSSCQHYELEITNGVW